MLRLQTIVILAACCMAVAFGQNGAAPSSGAPPDQTQPPPPVQVSNEVMLGRVDRKTMPVYPDEAMKKGIQGDVVFRIEVDETGKITSSTPVDGDPALVAASTDALRTFHFHPYLVNGVPVKVKSQLGFRFAVKKSADGASGRVACIASLPDQP
jgi:TonB family protein